MVYLGFALVLHETPTLVTLSPPVVPAPWVITQFWYGLIGGLHTDTLYSVPLGSAVAKANEPSAAMVRLSPPLSCSTRPEPTTPVAYPPIVSSALVLALHTTFTLTTSAVPTVPLPFVTTQV